MSPEIRKMRFPTIKTVLGSLALGALIVYTMRLPDPPKVQAPRPRVAAVLAPPAAESVLLAGPFIGAETQLPVTPARLRALIQREGLASSRVAIFCWLR